MIVAVLVTDESFTDVTVTVTLLGVGTVPGAVYTPVLASIVPRLPAVVVVGSDQVTSVQSVVPAVLMHPGLLTVAMNWSKVSPVPIVAVVGRIEMVMPDMIVTEAVAFLVVSACAVAVIVAVGVTVVVPFVVTVGTVFGAV